MNKATFIEMYLVKYNQISQEAAEKLVKDFADAFPVKAINGDVKCILGILGYIKHSQHEDKYDPMTTAGYVIREMETSVKLRAKNPAHIPASQSYMVEMNSDKMPKL